MVKKRKIKRSASRSTSAANRIAKSHKETFVKHTPLTSPKSEDKKDGLGTVKKLVFFIALLIIGASVLAKYTGANKVSRGSGIQDEACTATEECTDGYVCYQYSTHPFGCKKKCSEDDDCGNNHKCKAVVRFGKKRVKPMKVCVANREL